MGEEHLDRLPLSPRDDVGVGLSMSLAMLRAPSWIERRIFRAGVLG